MATQQNAKRHERKTYQSAVVLIPPESAWEPIQAIRERHDEQFRRWMPHITLLYPFRLKDEFDVLAGPFSEVCKKVQPFEVELAGYSYFKHRGTNYTFWLRPEPEDRLIELQTRLWEIVPDCSEIRDFTGGFTPHLSVGQVHSKRVFAKMNDILEKWEPVRFIASEVSFIWRGLPPEDIFQVAQGFALG